MHRFKIVMQASVVVYADSEEEAIGVALENLHDCTIKVLEVEDLTTCSIKSMPGSSSSAQS